MSLVILAPPVIAYELDNVQSMIFNYFFRLKSVDNQNEQYKLMISGFSIIDWDGQLHSFISYLERAFGQIPDFALMPEF